MKERIAWHGCMCISLFVCVLRRVQTQLSGGPCCLDSVLSAGDHLPSSQPSRSYRHPLHYSYFYTHTQRHILPSLHTSHLTHHACIHSLTRTHTAATSDTLCHLWLTRGGLYSGVIVSPELPPLACVDRVSQGFSTMVAEMQWAKVIKYHSSLHNCLPLSLFMPFFSTKPMSHLHSGAPMTCLFYFSALLFLSASPELQHEHKEKGRELILLHCWVGLVLSYGSKHRGRGIMRQIYARVYPPPAWIQSSFCKPFTVFPQVNWCQL